MTFLFFSIDNYLCFRGYTRPSDYPACPGSRAGLRTTFEFMAASFGPKTVLFWPYAGWAMLGLLLTTGGLLIMTWWRRPQERFRVVGLLAFLGP